MGDFDFNRFFRELIASINFDMFDFIVWLSKIFKGLEL